VSIGETRAITAVVKAANGTVLAAPTVTFTSSNAAVLSVAGSGTSATATSTGNGSATITATSGTATSSVSFVVAQAFATVAVTSAAPSVSIGGTTALTATARDAKGVAIAGTTGFTYASATPTAGIVSAAGVVTGIAPGSTVITTSLTKDGVTSTGTATVAVTAPAPSPTTFLAPSLTGANERPTPNATTGNGSAVFSVAGTTVSYTVAFQGLTSAPTGLHIHAPGNANAAAAVIVDLLTTPQTNTSGVLTGTFSATNIRNAGVSLDSLFVLMRNGNAYVNIHTAANPGGEVRGTLGTP